MTITWERLRLPIALTLVTDFTAHLLWYPMYGEYFAWLGDHPAANAIRRWYYWNPVSILGLGAGWATLYTILRRGDERPPIIATMASATELLLVFLCGYIRYSLFHAK